MLPSERRLLTALFVAVVAIFATTFPVQADEPVPVATPLPTDPVAPTAVPAAPIPVSNTDQASPKPRPEVAALPVQPNAPTFTIFATRQGLVGRRTANGHRIRPRDRFVALPSWRALSSRNGNEFQVRVTYRGRSVVLPVWDVGPWNTQDEYWNPKRRYSDLPVGMPMAQAARQNGYNNGRDEFGRRIAMPNGIDIADGAFWDDLGMSGSDWVEVTFLWMGQDPTISPNQPSGSDEPGQNEPGAVLVEDGAEGYSTPTNTNWYDASCGVRGRSVWTYAASNEEERENIARWTPKLSGAGLFEAFAYIPSCGPKATTAARYRITHEGAVTEVMIDQRKSAGKWISLGTYRMNPGAAWIELDDLTGEDDVAVRFDATKFVPRTDKNPPTSKVTAVTHGENGTILVRWEGSDDASGIASYDIQVRSMPDGEWTDWLVRTAQSEAHYTPAAPGSYSFRIRARDWVGHEEEWHQSDGVTDLVAQP